MSPARSKNRTKNKKQSRLFELSLALVLVALYVVQMKFIETQHEKYLFGLSNELSKGRQFLFHTNATHHNNISISA